MAIKLAWRYFIAQTHTLHYEQSYFFISTAKDWNALLVDSPFLSFLVLNVYIVADRKRLRNNKKQVSQAIAGNWRCRVERLKV